MKSKSILLISIVLNVFLLFLFTANFFRYKYIFLDDLFNALNVPRYETYYAQNPIDGLKVLSDFDREYESLYNAFVSRFGVYILEDGTMLYLSKDPTHPVSQEDITYFEKEYLGDMYLRENGAVVTKYDITPFLVEPSEDMTFINPLLDERNRDLIFIKDNVFSEFKSGEWDYLVDPISVKITEVMDTNQKAKVLFEEPKSMFLANQEKEVNIYCNSVFTLFSSDSELDLIYGLENAKSHIRSGLNLKGFCLDENCDYIGGAICLVE